VRVLPSYRERALVLSGQEPTTIVIGDVHVGLEQELARKGLTLPDQTMGMRARVEALLAEHAAERLIVLGDLKETIGRSSSADIARLRQFVRDLPCQVDLVPGNHDADLEWLGIENVRMQPATGMKVGDVALTHGHVWPAEGIMDAKVLVTSHNHPMLGLRDELGKLHKEPCWVRGPFRKAARERYPMLRKGAHFVIMPAFNELLGGHAINAPPREGEKEGLGPMSRNGLFDLDKATIWTLDGIEMGTVKSLRPLAAGK
jgi:putative SbcD/Mre11-related phosphoesterase